MRRPPETVRPWPGRTRPWPPLELMGIAQRILFIHLGAEVTGGADGWSVSVPGLPVAGEGATADEATDEALQALCEYAEDWADHPHEASNHQGFGKIVGRLDAADRATLGKAIADRGRGESWEQIVEDETLFDAAVADDGENAPWELGGQRCGNLLGEGQDVRWGAT